MVFSKAWEVEVSDPGKVHEDLGPCCMCGVKKDTAQGMSPFQGTRTSPTSVAS